MGKRRWPHHTPVGYREASPLGRRLLDLKLALGTIIRGRRRALGVTQRELANRLDTSQPRISRLERCAGETSLDFAVAALIELGATDQDLGHAFDISDDRRVLRLRELFSGPYAQARNRYRRQPRSARASLFDLQGRLAPFGE